LLSLVGAAHVFALLQYLDDFGLDLAGDQNILARLKPQFDPGSSGPAYFLQPPELDPNANLLIMGRDRRK